MLATTRRRHRPLGNMEDIMSRSWITAMLLALALALPARLAAHEGHTHNVQGTVVSFQGDHLDVKSKDGKAVTVTLDSKTSILSGKTKLDRTALKAGERVSVDYTEQKKVMVATAIKLSSAAAAAKK